MKRNGFIRMVALILCMSIMLVSIPITAFAFNNFEVEVVTKDAPIRKEASVFAKTIRKVSKGTTLTIVGEERNFFNNLWYKVEGGGYIYSSDVKKPHVHNVVFVGYEKMHPHLSMYECACKQTGYCGTETTKVEGCEQCYPHEHNYVLKGYEKMHPHYANYECSCGSGYCGTKTQKVKNCEKCYPHEHNYVLKGYETAHPHYANYECSCGSGYCGTETTKVDGCEECYPKVHKHDYQLIGYEKTHPHLSNYECSCGSAYCGTETIKWQECEICYPHEHEYLIVGYEEIHPHYANYQCACGSGYCGTKTIKHKDCETCYPKTEEHKHNYVLVGYEDEHPHYANYECSCGSGKCGFEENRLKDCDICYPKEDHRYILVNYEEEHPHYGIMKCVDCDDIIIDDSVTGTNELYCYECATTTFTPLDKFPGKALPIYSVNNGKVTYASFQEKEEVYSYSDELHMGLDLCGLAPGYGAVCDGANVLYYLIEGDLSGMLLSGIAFVPFIGFVTSGHRVIKKSGALLIEGSGKLFSESTQKTIKYTVYNTELLKRANRIIIRNSTKYADETVEAVAKIANNLDVELKHIYNGSELLLESSYRGIVTSDAGLKYMSGGNEGHRIFHILERHSSDNQAEYLAKLARGETNEIGRTFFSIKDNEIFDLIDNTYTNYKPYHIGNPKNGSIAYDYNLGYVIGKGGETKLRIVYDVNDLTKVITSYPIR